MPLSIYTPISGVLLDGWRNFDGLGICSASTYQTRDELPILDKILRMRSNSFAYEMGTFEHGKDLFRIREKDPYFEIVEMCSYVNIQLCQSAYQIEIRKAEIRQKFKWTPFVRGASSTKVQSHDLGPCSENS